MSKLLCNVLKFSWGANAPTPWLRACVRALQKTYKFVGHVKKIFKYAHSKYSWQKLCFTYRKLSSSKDNVYVMKDIWSD